MKKPNFSVTYSGNDCNVISNKKGFMFILGQIISNSVKYAVKDTAPTIQFSVTDNPESGQITLSVNDNGTGIPASDLPFVFDKGFTGDAGSFLSRSTGMGLYLVQKMAKDLAIDLQITSQSSCGTTIILMFPKVQYPVRRLMMQQQIRTQTPKKNKPAASLIISWLIILGVIFTFAPCLCYLRISFGTSCFRWMFSCSTLHCGSVLSF